MPMFNLVLFFIILLSTFPFGTQPRLINALEKECLHNFLLLALPNHLLSLNGECIGMYNEVSRLCGNSLIQIMKHLNYLEYSSCSASRQVCQW